MLAATLHVPVAGSNSSAFVPCPPTASTRPSASTVAVWKPGACELSSTTVHVFAVAPAAGADAAPPNTPTIPTSSDMLTVAARPMDLRGAVMASLLFPVLNPVYARIGEIRAPSHIGVRVGILLRFCVVGLMLTSSARSGPRWRRQEPFYIIDAYGRGICAQLSRSARLDVPRAQKNSGLSASSGTARAIGGALEGRPRQSKIFRIASGG